jgi:hypothetical protein
MWINLDKPIKPAGEKPKPLKTFNQKPLTQKPVGEKPDLRSKNFFVNKKIFPENFSRKIFGFTEILLSWVSVHQIFY